MWSKHTIYRKNIQEGVCLSLKKKYEGIQFSCSDTPLPCSIQLWIPGRGVENQVKPIGCKAVYHAFGNRVGWSMKSLYLYNDCDLVTIITAYIVNTHGTNSCHSYSSTSNKVFYSLQIWNYKLKRRKHRTRETKTGYIHWNVILIIIQYKSLNTYMYKWQPLVKQYTMPAHCLNSNI